MQQRKRSDATGALAWRLATRQALVWTFEHGYMACDFRDGAFILMPDPKGDTR